MSILVNVRGTNGSGKSTLAKQLIKKDSRIEQSRVFYFNEEIKAVDVAGVLTLCCDQKWVLLGDYYNKEGKLSKTGGLDRVKNKEAIYAMLRECCTTFETWDIFMEGIIPSTIHSTYRDWFTEIKEKYNRDTLLLYLLPDTKICLDRIYKRNGGKKINEKLVISKEKSIIKTKEKFKADGFICVSINTEKVEKKKMVKGFLKTVQRFKEGYYE